VDECGGQVEAPLHAAGVGADRPAQRVADVHQLGEVHEALIDLVVGEPVQPALEAQQLVARLLGVERRLLERDADVQTHLAGVGGDVVTGDGCAARRGCQEGAEHPDGGGLPGAVGTEEAVDLALLDLEVDLVDRREAVELADQLLRTDCRTHVRLRYSSGLGVQEICQLRRCGIPKLVAPHGGAPSMGRLGRKEASGR
jgi:hypothetical protein